MAIRRELITEILIYAIVALAIVLMCRQSMADPAITPTSITLPTSLGEVTVSATPKCIEQPDLILCMAETTVWLPKGYRPGPGVYEGEELCTLTTPTGTTRTTPNWTATVMRVSKDKRLFKLKCQDG